MQQKFILTIATDISEDCDNLPFALTEFKKHVANFHLHGLNVLYVNDISEHLTFDDAYDKMQDFFKDEKTRAFIKKLLKNREFTYDERATTCLHGDSEPMAFIETNCPIKGIDLKAISQQFEEFVREALGATWNGEVEHETVRVSDMGIDFSVWTYINDYRTD